MGSKREKLYYLDVAKGIGILMVILVHTDCGDNLLCGWIGSFCMPIFFIVSGILLNYLDSWKAESLGKVLWKRIRGILYPFFSFSALIILWQLFLRVVLKEGSFSNILETVKSTITLSGYDALWFLPTLFWAELALLLFIKYIKKPELAFVVFVVISSLCLYVVDHEMIEKYSTFWFPFIKLTRAMVASVFISVGYLYFKYKHYITNISKKIMIPVAAALLIIEPFPAQYNKFVDFAFCGIISYPLYIATGTVTSICILYILEVTGWRNKALEFCGINSLTMMAIHNPFGILHFVQNTYRNLPFSIGRYADDFVVAVVVIIITIPITLFINKFLPFFVKWPFGKKKAKA